MTVAVLGISALHARRHDSEQLLDALFGPAAGLVACTHLVDTPWRHEALSVEGPLDLLRSIALPPDVAAVLLDGDRTVTAAGDPDRQAGAREAAVAHRTRTGGRAVWFPGQELLTGDVPVADVLARTAIDRVVSAHGPYDEAAVVVTGGYVRPRFEGGKLTLDVGHDVPARLIPWEVPNPTPCCGADH